MQLRNVVAYRDVLRPRVVFSVQNRSILDGNNAVSKLALRPSTAASSSLNAASTAFRSRVELVAAKRATFNTSTPTHPLPSSNVDQEAPQRPFVILAEDDDVTAIVATQLLQQFGLYPRRCVDGSEAFDMACFSSTIPDLILMDLNMPGLDGIAATQLIREFYQARGLVCPVIIGFTSMTDTSSRSQMTSAGVSDFLAKPPTLQDIERIVLTRLR